MNFDFQVVLINPLRSQHPSFTPPDFVFRKPPYKITRIGWGYFSIRIQVILKPGYYLWPEANERELQLEWILDFEGLGSSTSYDYAITNRLTVQGDMVRGGADNDK